MIPRRAASELGDREYLLSDDIEGFSEYQQGSLSHVKQVQLDLLRLRDWPEADLRRADCRQLPFDSNAFDCVYSGDVIEHQNLMDGVTMLREMHRVLRPGGWLLGHTSPNAIFTNFVYPLAQPLLVWISGAEAIQVLEEHMAVKRRIHVHEYDRHSLRSTTAGSAAPFRPRRDPRAAAAGRPRGR